MEFFKPSNDLQPIRPSVFEASPADASSAELQTQPQNLLEPIDNNVLEQMQALRKCNHRLVTEIAERIQIEQGLLYQVQTLKQTLHQCQQNQASLIQSEKMSSLGQIVAGIAHEINNPINFIHGNLNPAKHYIQDLSNLLRLYQQTFPQGSPEIQQQIEDIDLEFLEIDLPKLLNSIVGGTDRIRNLVRSLHTFSRHDEAEMKRVDIHEGIESTLVILGSRLKARTRRQEISIIKDYAVIPEIECYPGKLNQVFMNVICNAIDAIEECHKFIFGLSDHWQQPSIRISTELVGEEWVKINVEDNGVGMSASVAAQAFDPFFTTKPVGKGTGLGLSISYQIITEKHGGRLSCSTNLGVGTTIVIQIPFR